jgi:hypothetical protein
MVMVVIRMRKRSFLIIMPPPYKSGWCGTSKRAIIAIVLGLSRLHFTGEYKYQSESTVALSCRETKYMSIADTLRLSHFRGTCDIIWIGIKFGTFPDLCFLAKTKGQSISISSTYILFLTKMQKRQTPSNGFALIEKRNHK